MPRPVALLIMALIAAAACSTDQTVNVPDTFALGDVSGIDVPTKVDDSGTALDIGAVPLDCPGGAGCVCKANADCDNAICIDDVDGRRCAIGCVDSCGPGYACVSLSGADESIHICAPRFLRLCNPCSHSKDCQGLGSPDAICSDFGARGSFCATSCDTSSDCPDSHKCTPITSAEGSQSKRCVPVQDNSGDPGIHTCPAWRVS